METIKKNQIKILELKKLCVCVEKKGKREKANAVMSAIRQRVYRYSLYFSEPL